MYPKCVHTQNFALLKSIVNILCYQTLPNTKKRRNRNFYIFLLIVSKVIRTFVTEPLLSEVAHCTSSRVSKFVICTQSPRSDWAQLM